MRTNVAIGLLFVLLSAPLLGAPATADVATAVDALLQGTYDNRDQAANSASADPPIPHVTIVIEPTPKPGFSLWHVHLETDPATAFDQTWAMQAKVEHDASVALIPYYQFKQTSMPTAGSFDPKDWLSLEACALRGEFAKDRFEGMSEGEPCVAVSMSVGARRALLPVGILRDGDGLHADLNLRGVRTRIDAKKS